jgi:uncharacterized radical SAM superfamily Fe-S cluster-containing enzyme
VWRSENDADGVWLTRNCPEHGEFEACIASDARFYWLAKGDPSNGCGASCDCPASEQGVTGTLGRNAGKRGTPEVLSTCLALIEIVDSCNLACPTCFADSPVGMTGNRLKAKSLRDLKGRISGVLERKGKIEILQLSGGEPTLHPAFMELLDWIHAEGRIDYCLLNYDLCRGVSFQPMFGGGRGGDGGQRLNAADVIMACVGQSDGGMRYEDFTPLPCGDPNCATIGYLLRTPAGTRSISDFVDFSSVQDFLHDKVRYELADLVRCGCENTELGALLHGFEVSEKNAFRVFIKPFMDSWTWDEDRIDRCCTHVIRPDGKLDSFCRYYAAVPA